MKKTITLTLTILILIFVGITAFYMIQISRAKKEALEEAKAEFNLESEYGGFWNAVPNCAKNKKTYNDYSVVNDSQLYFRIAVYKKKTGGDVSLEDFQDFLSEEYTEEGKLRIENQPERIKSYLEWYNSEGENTIDPYYWDKLSDFYSSLEENNEKLTGDLYDLNLEKMEALTTAFMDDQRDLTEEELANWD